MCSSTRFYKYLFVLFEANSLANVNRNFLNFHTWLFSRSNALLRCAISWRMKSKSPATSSVVRRVYCRVVSRSRCSVLRWLTEKLPRLANEKRRKLSKLDSFRRNLPKCSSHWKTRRSQAELKRHLLYIIFKYMATVKDVTKTGQTILGRWNVAQCRSCEEILRQQR